MADEEPTEEARWVYIGQRLDTGKKLCHFYVAFRDDGTPDVDNMLGYAKRIDRNVSMRSTDPGAVFIVHTTKAGKSVMIGGELAPKYERRFDDEKLIAEWTVLDAAANAQHKANKRMLEEMSDDVLGKCLGPVLRAMRKTNALGRQAIKIVILDYLTRHGDFR